jgi:hypothetical protein
VNIHYVKELEEPIVKGIKIHTLRKYGIEKGTVLNHVVYPYTKNKRRVILENICTGYEKVEIRYNRLHRLFFFYVNNKVIDPDKARELAINDGFKSLEDLLDYIFKGYSMEADLSIAELFINHWTEKRYI